MKCDALLSNINHCPSVFSVSSHRGDLLGRFVIHLETSVGYTFTGDIYSTFCY